MADEFRSFATLLLGGPGDSLAGNAGFSLGGNAGNLPGGAVADGSAIIVTRATHRAAHDLDDAVPAATSTATTPSGFAASECAGAQVRDAAVRAAEAADPRVLDLLDTFTVELARLVARAAELLEERAEASLADLAQRVLGRELHAAPADIAALLAQTVADFTVAEPLVLRVSSADASRVDCPWPIRVDPALAAGDFAVDVEDGTYDLKLQTRLAALLAAHRIAL